MRFGTSATERMRITSDGVTFNGDTAAANALDDYEEGTWTPVFGQSGGGDGGVTYAHQNGFYTKIGNLVTVYVDVGTSQMWSWQGSYMYLTLPFTSANDNWYGSCSVWEVSDEHTTADQTFAGYVGPNTNQLRMYRRKAGNHEVEGATVWNAVGRVAVSIQYHTAS